MIILAILSLALILGCQVPTEPQVVEDVPSTEEVEISDSLDDLDELDQLDQDLDADLGLEELDTLILE